MARRGAGRAAARAAAANGRGGPSAPSGPKWSAAAEKRFLVELAVTSNVTKAAEAAGVSTALVYARRVRSAQFRQAWKAALCEGYALLEAAMLERALFGVEGKGEGRAFSEATGLRLLAMHRETVRAAAAEFAPPETQASLRRKLDAQLAEIGRRLRDDGE